MARQAATATAQQVPQEVNPVILDVVIESTEGNEKLRVVVDLRHIYQDRERYAEALKYTRNIPFDIDTISSSDPIALIIANQRPNLVKRDPNAPLLMARKYYENQTAVIDRESILLAAVKHKDNNAYLSGAPTNQDQPRQDDSELPGITPLPEPFRDFDDPVEARLQKFYEIVNRDPSMLQKFYLEFNRAMGTLAGLGGGGPVETDEDGFQSGTTDS